LKKSGVNTKIAMGFQDLMPEIEDYNPDLMLLDIILPPYNRYN
jgi:DNA-binding response OmpR family regulator